MIYLILGLILSIMMQAFFSGIETGLVSVMRSRVKYRADAGDRKAALIDHLLKTPGHLLAATLIGTNICVVCSSVLAGTIASRLIDKAGLAMLTASIVLSGILMTFEIIPKNWFRQAPEERCIRFAMVLYIASKILGPVASVMSGVSGYLIHLISPGHENRNNAMLLRNDFRLLLLESEDGGMLSSEAADILDRAVDFHGKQVGSIMTPSAEVITVQASWSVEDALGFCRDNHISRAPVCPSGDPDNWIGIFSIYNVFFKIEESQWAKVKVSEITSPAAIINASYGIHDVAARARNAECPLLFVVSDQQPQQTIGVITPADVAEALFGSDICVHHPPQEQE